MDIYFNPWSSGDEEDRPIIASGSVLEEDNANIVGHYPDGTFLENASTFTISMTGPKYIRYGSTSYNYQLSSIDIAYGQYNSSNPKSGLIAQYTAEVPFSAPGTTKSSATYTVSVSDLLYVWSGTSGGVDRSTIRPDRISIRLKYIGISGDDKGYYAGFNKTLVITSNAYTAPSVSAFTMSRALSDETVSQQGAYGRYDITSNYTDILASDEPQFIINNTALTLSFTRSGTDYSHAAESDGIGLLQDSGAALELGNEETFTVTAALTDGISTSSMSALLSANFAIFNANSTKNGIAFGKYATQTGFDCNMAAEFRQAVTFDVPPIGLECLWKRTDTSTSMSATTVTLTRAITAGELILVGYAAWQGNQMNHMALGVGGRTISLEYAYGSNNRNGNRDVVTTGGSDQASISSATYNGATSNQHCIPLGIYAVSGGWFNFDTADAEYVAP